MSVTMLAPIHFSRFEQKPRSIFCAGRKHGHAVQPIETLTRFSAVSVTRT